MISKLMHFMDKKTTKNKETPVTKPVKGNALPIGEDGILKDKKGESITTLTVVDQDDDVVATFRYQDHGPRYWFKAHQYATNYSTLEQLLRVKELQ